MLQLILITELLLKINFNNTIVTETTLAIIKSFEINHDDYVINIDLIKNINEFKMKYIFNIKEDFNNKKRIYSQIFIINKDIYDSLLSFLKTQVKPNNNKINIKYYNTENVIENNETKKMEIKFGNTVSSSKPIIVKNDSIKLSSNGNKIIVKFTNKGIEVGLLEYTLMDESNLSIMTGGKKKSVKKSPVKKSPVKKSPAKKSPVKKSPVKKRTVKKRTVKK